MTSSAPTSASSLPNRLCLNLLAQVRVRVSFPADEKRIFNQIRGHEYLAMFGLVEEFILPFVVDHACGAALRRRYRVRALLQFAGEEAKHIHLFKRFREEFDAGFGSPCEFIGPAEDVKRSCWRTVHWASRWRSCTSSG